MEDEEEQHELSLTPVGKFFLNTLGEIALIIP
jgi:hypothetical protein